MGIGKSRITPSINVDDMLEKAEINHEIEDWQIKNHSINKC